MPLSAVDVLLQLLERTDVNTIELLLEPDVLRALLAHHNDWSDDAILQALKTQIPGELLLQLFERGLSGEQLLASLEPNLRAQAEQRIARQSEKKQNANSSVQAEAQTKSASEAADKPQTTLQGASLLGVILVALAGIGPALFFVLDIKFAIWTYTHLAAIVSSVFFVGAIGGTLIARGFHPSRPWFRLTSGALAGGLAALGGGAGIVAYVVWGPGARGQVFKAELALAFILGTVPGLLVATTFNRLLGLMFATTQWQ